MSATLRDRHGLAGHAGGGVPARRAVARWAWRLFRREWRQQILVLALLILTVAAAAFSVSAAYNVASLPGPLFGSANHLLQLNGTNPKALAADIAAARKAFGTIQVIGRRFVAIPGSAQTVEFRAQNPHGPYSDPMLALTQGRYPTGAGQTAITGQIAQTLQLHIGSLLSIGGHHQTVTGIVENPSDLNDQFVLVSPPAAEERDRFVTHCVAAGAARESALHLASELLLVAERMDIDGTRAITPEEIGSAADRWVRHQRRHGRITTTRWVFGKAGGSSCFFWRMTCSRCVARSGLIQNAPGFFDAGCER